MKYSRNGIDDSLCIGGCCGEGGRGQLSTTGGHSVWQKVPGQLYVITVRLILKNLEYNISAGSPKFFTNY